MTLLVLRTSDGRRVVFLGYTPQDGDIKAFLTPSGALFSSFWGAEIGHRSLQEGLWPGPIPKGPSPAVVMIGSLWMVAETERGNLAFSHGEDRAAHHDEFFVTPDGDVYRCELRSPPFPPP